ncbi:LPS export ABC transporter permease LptG [Ruixingdingia sedimenti]|uniref:LPS export ABC transporter permease LptG n=1 Tax=Ruixingdingia sedimenti TaxID=3073604 RepID=A0ABU1F7X1_9RHOB|nr:LPS export ABC transporter permease LptG [Xinfangfangia sp. LG-4]MDR5652970.1 LPS export ABC transporter permease LptG [Xinfangfangia sp. LG-4]
MTLWLYFARRFALTVGVVLAVFAGILMLIDMVEQIRRYAGSDLSLGQAAQLALLNMPGALYRVLPLVVMLGSIALFLALARSSELVVTRAAGRSALGALVSPVAAALVLGAVGVALINPLVAATGRASDQYAAELRRGPQSVLSISEEGMWLRQGNPDGQTVIRAARASRDGTHLFAVTFLAFDEGGLPVTRIEAEEAVLEPGRWRLAGAKEWHLNEDNPEVSARLYETAELATNLTVDSIRDSFGTPAAIPIWDLPEFIAGLERAGFTSQKHRVWLQMELALPVLLAAMVLVAAGFTMRHVRFGRMGVLVLLAVLSGFAIFFLRNFAQILGENGQIPPALAAWSPPVVAILFALSLLLHLEEG